MHLTNTPRGAARSGGRGGGGRNGGRGYAYLSEETRKTPSSTISDTSTKRAKFDEMTDDGSDLFPTEDDESMTLTN
jgi:hypothetical protein